MSVLLEADRVSRRYPSRGLRRREDVVAVDQVSLTVHRGETVGLVGESGSGKSTIARLLLALETPDHGTVRFDGVPISHLPESQVRPMRRHFQAVFQDPLASLNPRLRVSTSIAEPLVAHRLGTHAERRLRVAELVELVGLPAAAARRKPSALSGGERQRVSIARALAPEPELLVLDEPVSSLDTPVQAQILSLLDSLKQELGLSLLLISHDLNVVAEVSERVAVMYRGRILEEGPTRTVFSSPAHPHTRALLDAVPVMDPGRPPWDPPATAVRPPPSPSACRYADRCPIAVDACALEPELEEVDNGHRVACWRPGDGGRVEG